MTDHSLDFADLEPLVLRSLLVLVFHIFLLLLLALSELVLASFIDELLQNLLSFFRLKICQSAVDKGAPFFFE